MKNRRININAFVATIKKSVLQRLDEFGMGEAEIPSCPVFHYTNAAGLKGILETKRIFATHVRYLNDLSEITFGVDVAA